MDWKNECMTSAPPKSSKYAAVRFPDDRPETVEVVCQCWLNNAKDKKGRTQCYFPTGEHLLHPNKKLTASQYLKLLHSFSLPPVTTINSFEFDWLPAFPEVQNVSYVEATKAADNLKKSGWVSPKGKIELQLEKRKLETGEWEENRRSMKLRKRPYRKADDGPVSNYCDCDSGRSTDEGEDFYSLPNPQAVCIISLYFTNFTSILVQFYIDFFDFSSTLHRF